MAGKTEQHAFRTRPGRTRTIGKGTQHFSNKKQVMKVFDTVKIISLIFVLTSTETKGCVRVKKLPGKLLFLG